MKITWNDLTVNFEHVAREKLVDDWKWLIGESMLPITVTSIGDMFLQDADESIYWLVTGSAELTKVADSYDEFQNKLNNEELTNEWFLIPLVIDLKNAGLELEQGKLYGFKQLPVLGGEYTPSNFELTDIEVHCALTGQINYKIKDLPDGTKVNFEITE